MDASGIGSRNLTPNPHNCFLVEVRPLPIQTLGGLIYTKSAPNSTSLHYSTAGSTTALCCRRGRRPQPLLVIVKLHDYRNEAPQPPSSTGELHGHRAPTATTGTTTATWTSTAASDLFLRLRFRSIPSCFNSGLLHLDFGRRHHQRHRVGGGMLGDGRRRRLGGGHWCSSRDNGSKWKSAIGRR